MEQEVELDAAPLPAALEQLGREVSEAGGAQVIVQALALDDGERLPAEVATVLFRVTQEALTNIGKHRGIVIEAVYGGAPIGKQITIDDQPFTVIGVYHTTAGFLKSMDGRGPDRPRAIVPSTSLHRSTLSTILRLSNISQTFSPTSSSRPTRTLPTTAAT